MESVKVIIYDDENMIYRDGVLDSIERGTNFSEERQLDGSSSTFIHGYTDTIICQHNGEKQSIELDPTTMKRILKYNKEVEIEKLNKEIENKKEYIKELDDKLQDKEKRWEKVKEYIANIYGMDLDGDDEDDYDWEY